MSTMGPHIRSFLSQYDSIEEGYNEEYEHSYYPISSPDVPIASACSIPSFGSRASPAMMEFSGSLSLQTPPQYLSAMATPPAFRKPAYPPSPFSDSTPHMSPYMSENNESPFGVPMFHPPLAQYEPVPWSWWNPPQHRSSSFHSSSSLSFSSSQGDSSASSCSSYHPGDQLSVRSTPTSSFHNFEESALASPSENLEGSNAPGIHSEGDVNSSNRHCGQLVDANNPPMNSLVHFNEKHEPYAVIIYRALMSVPEKRMVLADIYDYFRQTQSARAGRDSGWKNSIRHNLSMNGDFIKEPLPDEDNTRRNIWVLSKHAQKHGITSTTRYRRTSTRPPKRFQPTRRKYARNRKRVSRRAISPMPQLQLSPPKIERMDQMAIQAPIWTPPQTPVACPKSQSVPIGVENPKAATDAQVKIEDLASPFDMDHHSDTVIASPNALENTYFGHDELYVRENDSWHAVPYTSSFTEQYNLVTEAAKQGRS